MKISLSPLEWHILNTTADDWESVRNIAEEIQSLVPGTDKDKMIEVIRNLFASGLLEKMPLDGQDPADLSDMDRIWFGMTPAGRTIWDAEAETYFPES